VTSIFGTNTLLRRTVFNDICVWKYFHKSLVIKYEDLVYGVYITPILPILTVRNYIKKILKIVQPLYRLETYTIRLHTSPATLVRLSLLLSCKNIKYPVGTELTAGVRNHPVYTRISLSSYKLPNDTFISGECYSRGCVGRECCSAV